MGKSTQGLKIIKQVEEVKEVNSNPYGGYETLTKTTQVKTAPNSNLEKYRKHVQDAMLEGIKKYGVKVENQPIHKCNDTKKTIKTNIFSGHCFIKEIKHELRGKVYEFILPSLYMKGCGDNNIKRVCNEETQRVIETDSQVGLLPEQAEIVTK